MSSGGGGQYVLCNMFTILRVISMIVLNYLSYVNLLPVVFTIVLNNVVYVKHVRKVFSVT